MRHKDKMGPVTRATTTRAAKLKAQERIRRARGVEDVDFPRLPSFRTIDETYDRSEGCDRYRPPSTDGHYGARINILEGEVKEVREEVTDINNKLDFLVNAAMSNSKPKHQSTPPPPRLQREKLEDTIPFDPLPPPAQLRRAANYDGYVDDHMRAEQLQVPTTQGKKYHMTERNGEAKIQKPYMYIQREACQTEKHKLDVRTSLGALEYIHVSIRLVRDNRAYDPADYPHIMRHIQDLSHDAMERAWPAVRRWSQFIWDMVEIGELVWSDYQAIQNERIRIAMTAPGGGNPATHQAQVTGSNKAKEYLCRDFKAKAGCRHRSHHMDDNVRVLHYCAFCDCVGKACPHSVFACNNKRTQPQFNRQQEMHNMFGNQQQGWGVHPTPLYNYNQGPPQFSKNGYQAPRPM